MSKLRRLAPCTYLLEKEGAMRVPGLVIASEKLLSEMEIERALEYDELDPHTQSKLLQEIYHRVPSGVGHGHRGAGVSDADYKVLLQKGASWSVEQGYGLPPDLEHCESNGCIAGADPEAVSHTAKERGRKQLGSIGSGNHFVELGIVQQLFLPEIAAQ